MFVERPEHHQHGAFRSNGRPDGIDDAIGAALYRPDAPKRRVHHDHVTGLHAERAQVGRDGSPWDVRSIHAWNPATVLVALVRLPPHRTHPLGLGDPDQGSVRTISWYR